MKRVGLTRLFNLLFPPLLSFHEAKKSSRKANAPWLLCPVVGRPAEISVKGLGCLVLSHGQDHLPRLLVEKCSSMPRRKETDQISAFWIKWEERLVRSVQLAFLAARSLVFAGNQADVKCSLCKYYSPAFPALLYSSSWRRRDSSSLAASRKID